MSDFEDYEVIDYLQYTLLLLIPGTEAIYYPGSVKFTIHFATINTVRLLYFIACEVLFTIHFATINTKRKIKKAINPF